MNVWNVKCQCENSKQSFVKTYMHNNCMRLYGNLAAEYATHLLQKKKNLKMKLTWILALLVKPANFSASSFENVVYFPAISNLAKLCLPRIGPYKKPKIRKSAEILSSRGKSCHIYYLGSVDKCFDFHNKAKQLEEQNVLNQQPCWNVARKYFEFRGTQFWLADTTYSVLVYHAKKLSRYGRVVASESLGLCNNVCWFVFLSCHFSILAQFL